jgi:hypothetical protein
MRKLVAIVGGSLALLAQSVSAQMPPNGSYQLRPVTPSAACLTNDGGFGARLPFVKHVACPAAQEANYSWVFTRQPNGRYQIVHNATQRCATVARGVILGPPAIDLRTCENPIPADQLFQLVPKTGGVVEFHTANGQCWYWRFEALNSEHIQRDCGFSTAFRMIPAK